MPDTSSSALLSVRDLSCTLGERSLWRDVSFTLCAGERWAVTGPSGSGKTQLLRTLAGLASPSGGGIRFANRPLAVCKMPDYRARVVYVPQRPSLPEGSVKAVLAAPFGLRVHRGKAFSPSVARRYLDALGMGGAFLAQRTEDLSGGETQLVATLRAVLIEPSVLLLDEPTASLDAARAACIEALVDGWLERERDRAWVWTSHDREQVARMSDQTLALRAA